MWHINSITIPTGETGSIWGGYQAAVGPQELKGRLGPEGSSYIVAAGDLGSLTIEDKGSAGIDGQTWVLLINGVTQYLYRDEGQLDISIDTSNVAHFSGGNGVASVALLSEMQQIGPITRQVISLVSGAPSLYGEWDANPMAVLYSAGFPSSSMTNLRQKVGTAPDCCTQFIDWLGTIQFKQAAELSAEEFGGWLACALCKGFFIGLAAVLFVAVAAACIAAGPVSAPAAVAVLETTSAVAALSAGAGLTVGAVARMAASVFFAAGATAFVASLVDSLCQTLGACSP